MALTQNDLQAIGNLIDQKLDARDKKLDHRFEQIDHRFGQIDHRFEQIGQRFEQIDHRFEQIGQRFEQIDQRFEQVAKTIITQMKKETKTIVEFFDKEYLNHDKRIKRIEKHLDLPPLND